MKIVLSLVLACALTAALSPTSFAGSKQRQAVAPITRANSQGFQVTAADRFNIILWQDLFDRANPVNVRTDWPAPPAQPAQH